MPIVFPINYTSSRSECETDAKEQKPQDTAQQGEDYVSEKKLAEDAHTAPRAALTGIIRVGASPAAPISVLLQQAVVQAVVRIQLYRTLHHIHIPRAVAHTVIGDAAQIKPAGIPCG